jgi:glycosyltransferase involved in cell wall biosynthesis
VRGPTSLLPAIAKKARRNGVVFLALLVDDTSNWQGKTGTPKWRERAIRRWLKIQADAIARVGRHSFTMAISQSIVRDPRFTRTALVRTTSLSKADLTGPDKRTRTWPAPGEQIRLLFTGRISSEKGLYELWDALQMLVAEGRNVHLEMAGALYDDPTKDDLLAKAAAAGMSDRITYSGFLEAGPELLAAYLRNDIYVLPTYGEGSVTRTIKEAFATGLPVVTTSVREIAEFLTDGEHAVLVPDHDAPALAKGIARMIDDPALRARVAANGFEFVQGFTNEASAAIVAGHVRDEIRRGVQK